MHRRPLLIGALGCAACAALSPVRALAQSPSTHQHRFRDADHWAQVFDDPKRDVWQKPNEVLRALALPPHAIVADLGAGTGYFAMRLAKVLPAGRVYAVDLEPDMVRHLAARAKRENLANVEAVQARPDDPQLPGKVDLVLFVDVYHHIDERERYLRRLAEHLRPEGRIAVIDFRPDAPMGPPRSARIAAQRVKDELQRAGYALVQEHDFLPNQYFLVFERAR
jgi:SAM-dependent methyltransferase